MRKTKKTGAMAESPAKTAEDVASRRNVQVGTNRWIAAEPCTAWRGAARRGAARGVAWGCAGKCAKVHFSRKPDRPDRYRATPRRAMLRLSPAATDLVLFHPCRAALTSAIRDACDAWIISVFLFSLYTESFQQTRADIRVIILLIVYAEWLRNVSLREKCLAL